MLYLSMLASLIAAVSAFSGDALLSKFEDWKRQHGKAYASIEEMTKAMKAFAANEEIIQTHNAKGLSYTLGHNEFSDLTWDEFRSTHMSEIYTNKAPKNMDRVHINMGAPLPNDVDWVAKGAVTPVKNQQRCGSCWAFSTTGSVEGAYQIATGSLLSLSEEDLVQCDHNGDQGCNGGLMDNAFEWIEKNGLCTEADYPYTSGTGITGTCATKKCAPAVTLTGYKDVPQGDETALQNAVSIGPVSIAIEADKSAFQLYKSGVLDNPLCGKKLDHGVLIVGYGTDSATGKDFWKVKNSWGPTWGESGYIRMVRNKNQCGLANSASYPKGVQAYGPVPPGPSPTPPSPPTPSTSHYEDPKYGCQSDETEVSVTGVPGDFCSPKCSFFKSCPTDKPAGVTALPQCALSTPAGLKYCALICSPTEEIVDQKVADAQCGVNASCKSVAGAGVGLCTYDD